MIVSQSCTGTILADWASCVSVTLHLTNFAHSGRICCWHNCPGGFIFVLKTAAVVLAFLSLMVFTPASRAQDRLIPTGNVYVGAAYADSVDVVNRYTFRGWNASVEVIPFAAPLVSRDSTGWKWLLPKRRPGVQRASGAASFQELRQVARIRAGDGRSAANHLRRNDELSGGGGWRRGRRSQV